MSLHGRPLLFIVLACGCGVQTAAAGSVSGTVSVVDGAGEELSERSEVVVFVEGADAESREALSRRVTDRRSPHLSHKNFSFAPRVLAIRTGTTVDFLNDDRIFHNAFSLSKSKPFDLGIYPQGTSKLVTFEESGLVRVYCNIHPDMVSNILVLENNYSYVTNDDGRYRIDDLPTGRYTLRVWAEYAEPAAVALVVDGSGEIKKDFVITAKPQFRRHNNKFGKPYREKY